MEFLAGNSRDQRRVHYRFTSLLWDGFLRRQAAGFESRKISVLESARSRNDGAVLSPAPRGLDDFHRAIHPRDSAFHLYSRRPGPHATAAFPNRDAGWSDDVEHVSFALRNEASRTLAGRAEILAPDGYY